MLKVTFNSFQSNNVVKHHTVKKSLFLISLEGELAPLTLKAHISKICFRTWGRFLPRWSKFYFRIRSGGKVMMESKIGKFGDEDEKCCIRIVINVWLIWEPTRSIYNPPRNSSETHITICDLSITHKWPYMRKFGFDQKNQFWG